MIGKYSDQMTFAFLLGRMLEQVPNTVDKREGSVIYDALAPAAAELTKAYMELDVVMDETFVDTASLQYLMLRCKERGIAIQGETAALVRGLVSPSSLELPMGTRFSCESIHYSVIEKTEMGMYHLRAETLGSSGNLYSGLLVPLAFVDGLESAQIESLLIPGEDGDSADSLCEKYYASIEGEAFGGNIADYQEKVNALPGVGGVKVYPAWYGGGTVRLVILASDHAPPSEALVSEVQTAVDPEGNHGQGLGFAPIGHAVTVVAVAAQDVSVRSNITFVAKWAFMDAKNHIEAVIRAYFLELAEQWANSETIVVRIAQLETRILALPFVLDIADTTLNGQAKNLFLHADCIPKLHALEGLP